MLDRADEIWHTVSNLNQPLFAIRAHHIANRRGDHGLSSCQVFRSLCGTDKSRRLVARKEEQSCIPTRKIGRQVLVFFASQIVNITQLRKNCRVDLYNRSDDHELPIRPLSCDTVEQFNIKPFVYYAKETEARVRSISLIIGFSDAPFSCRSGLGEMLTINAAWECVDRPMLRSFHLVKTMPTRENKISPLKKLLLEFAQTCGRSTEG